MIKKLRKSKKGFSLVELIVVLVILAILAAILIPTLSNYVDKANDRVSISEARNAVMAMQTLLSEEYGRGAVYTAGIFKADTVLPAKSIYQNTTGDAMFSALTAAAQTLGDLATGTIGNVKIATGNKVSALLYGVAGSRVLYTAGAAAGDRGTYLTEKEVGNTNFNAAVDTAFPVAGD